jgi:peptidoglycan hydrolase CwlO-like protein
MRKIYLSVLIIVFVIFFIVKPVIFAQSETPIITPTDSPTPTPDTTKLENDIKNRINDLQGKINVLKGTEKTLSSQIDVMDSQIALTQLRISSAKSDIAQLESDIKIASNKVNSLEGSLDQVTKLLLKRVVSRYEAGADKTLLILLSSLSVNDYLTKQNYLKLIQEHDRQLLFEMQQAKNDYANQKTLYEDREKKLQALRVQLENYTKELDSENANKKDLLAQTQGDENNYQKLLAQAKAQLLGFSQFTANQGGAGLLSNQTVCDGWGCYYNQRDSQWGALSLNGTQYTIASDGCLVTSMAMMMTHYGHKVTPIDINSNSGNFASYYPAYLLYTTTAGGVTADRVGTSIDATLNNSNHDPVIVGVNAYGGTHFIVLKSGANGDYIMNDPYLENGHDISFSAHYSLNSVFEVDKVVF